ncbi:MAG: hypothetical protein KME04_04760 [Pleurocapsa minor GSE-CHR-MK-17-07R]|nr:hypothetical protein [Pleurocapsa minor GSE-CHR-MK 17-07R]
MQQPVVEADPSLGNALASYPSDRLRALIIGGIIGATIAALVSLTIAPLPDWWAPPLTVIIMAGTTLGLGWFVLHFWNREIILYERGFLLQEGSRWVPFLYAEMSSIRLYAERLSQFGGLLKRDVYRFTVTSVRGEQFVITNRVYRRAAELGTRLTEQLNKVLEPRLRERMDNGEQVPFADGLTMSAIGLHAGGKDLRWADFGGYSAQGGRLHLLDREKKSWFSMPLREVDNLTLLVDLLKEQRA